MTSLMISEHFSGPIPHPKHIAVYEKIVPGAADRIIRLRMAKSIAYKLSRKFFPLRFLTESLG